MKKLLLLALLATLTVPAFAQTSYAKSNCPAGKTCGMAYFSHAAREAKLKPYKERLAELGGVYIPGTNRFQVMKQIFEIEKLA